MTQTVEEPVVRSGSWPVAPGEFATEENPFRGGFGGEPQRSRFAWDLAAPAVARGAARAFNHGDHAAFLRCLASDIVEIDAAKGFCLVGREVVGGSLWALKEIFGSLRVRVLSVETLPDGAVEVECVLAHDEPVLTGRIDSASGWAEPSVDPMTWVSDRHHVLSIVHHWLPTRGAL